MVADREEEKGERKLRAAGFKREREEKNEREGNREEGDEDLNFEHSLLLVFSLSVLTFFFLSSVFETRIWIPHVI